MDNYFPFGRKNREIFDAVAALIVVLDGSGRIKAFNKACEQLTGYQFKEVENRFVWDFLLPPEEIQSTREVFHNLTSIQVANKHINHWQDKKGKPYLISWSNTVVTNEENGGLYIVATGVDISKHSAAIELLDERSAKLKAIFDSALEGIIVADDKGFIEKVNLATMRMFGYKADELEGKNVKILLPENERNLHEDYLQRYLETGEKNIIDIGREVIGQREDRSQFPLYLSVAEIFYDDSKSFVAMLHDLSERNKNLEELHQAQKMEAMGQLTGGLAHDFNNLLTVIQGDLEMLYDYVACDEGKELLDDASENVGLGAQLIERLLTFGRRQSLSPKIININRLLSGMSSMLRRTIGEDIDIIEEFGDKIWPVSADPGLTENAILNLILNARDAMPAGGELILKTENYVKKSDKNRLSDLEEGSYVKISVCDNGTGMSPQTLEHLYEPFFTTKPSGSGTGLGLSMVYGFVTQSGGNIKITSQLEKGTNVVLYLPRAVEQSVEKKILQPISPPLRPGKGENILYVEDNPKVRQVNARRLMDIGYTVFTAKDGPTALNIYARKDHVDLLLTDIVMPGGMTGIEVADYIKKQQPDMKVLLTTGYSEDIISNKGKKYNILMKPYSKDVLAAQLREILDK